MIPEPKSPYYLQSALDRAIEQFGENQNADQKRFIQHELNHIKSLADVDAGLAAYRAQSASMGRKELTSEEHDSHRLGLHLRASGKPKPDDRCDAHAIVAGAHKNSAVARALLAQYKIRIDDPDNGCWLPRRTADTPHWAFTNAVPHSRIHRFNYYRWLEQQVTMASSEPIMRFTLQRVASRLQDGTIPPQVMLAKGQTA